MALTADQITNEQPANIKGDRYKDLAKTYIKCNYKHQHSIVT